MYDCGWVRNVMNEYDFPLNLTLSINTDNCASEVFYVYYAILLSNDFVIAIIYFAENNYKRAWFDVNELYEAYILKFSFVDI